MSALSHLTDVHSLSDETFHWLLSRSLIYRDMMDRGSWPAPILQNRLVAHVFLEDSTRTLMSFEVAAKRMGAVSVTLPVDRSSVNKGETLEDTILTLGAQGTDFLILRAKEPGSISRAVAAVADEGLNTAIINAGEGALGHPTQGLLDAATALRHLGRQPEDGLDGTIIAIIGDIRHSRVARSSVAAFRRLGAEVRLGGPEELLPGDEALADAGDVTPCASVDEALAGAHIAMTLRIQRERVATAITLSAEDYHSAHGLTHERLLAHAHPDVKIMHPGPMNRNIEISDALADDPDRSLIRSQVRQGVALRMAVLEGIERRKTR